MLKRSILSSAVAAALHCFVAPVALAQAAVPAQSPESGSTAASDSAGLINEVVVTARRRDERVQDVPISIQALSGDDLETRNITNLDNVAQSVPNIQLSNGGFGQGNFSVRGIQGAGVFIDGVFQQSLVGVSQRSVVEMERVEVLRGPQGTLFGRDTTGGAILMFSKPPAETFGVRTIATVGSYDRRDIVVHADIPLHEQFLTKFSFANEQREGFVTSILTGRKTGDVNDQSLRGDFVWRPLQNFQARLTADVLKSRSTLPNYQMHIYDPPPAGVGPGGGFQVPPHQYYEIMGVPYDCQSVVAGCPGGRVGDLQSADNFNGPPGLQLDENNFNLKLSWDITDTMSLSSLTNYNDQMTWSYANADAGPVDYASFGSYVKRHSWSQEFQLNGELGSRIAYVVGAYAWETTARNRSWSWPLWDWAPGGGPNPRFNFASLAASPFCTAQLPGVLPCGRGSLRPSNLLTEVGQEGQAYFGELSFKLTDTLSATVGGRYHEQTNSTATLVPVFAGIPDIPGHLPGTDPTAFVSRGAPREDDFSKETFRVSLTNKFTADLMVYASWAQGYNAGGATRVNVPDAQGVLQAVDFSFDPETIDTYEVGLRSQWLGGALKSNLTLFYTQWQDIQLRGTIRDPATGAVLPQFVSQNAAAAEAQGAELAVTYRPVRQLLLNLDLGVLDTKYTEISPNVSRDLRLGDKFGRSPELQGSFGVQWTQDIGDNSLLLRTDYNYSTGYMRTYIPSDRSTNYSGERWEIPAMGLLQARVAFRPNAANWELAAFGTNLTDERYVSAGFMSPALLIDNGLVARPREYGLSLKLSFE